MQKISGGLCMKRKLKFILVATLAALMGIFTAACDLFSQPSEEPEHEHEFSNTWTGAAEGHYHKATCGHDAKTQPENHVFDNGVTDGDDITYTCTVCNWKKTEERFPGHTHKFAEDWTGAAEGHYHKASCGHDYAVTVEDHEFAYVGIEGENIVYSCAVCNWVLSEYYGPHTHSLQKVDAVDADCKTEGNIEYYKCADCGKLFDDENATNELTKENTVIGKTGHSYPSTWTQKTAPTLDKEGVEGHTCPVCGTEETRPVAKLTVISIEITAQPTKTVYEVGESFEKAGMVVTALLSDDTTMIATDYTVNKTVLAGDDTEVIITFYGKSAKVAITVNVPAQDAVGVKQALTSQVGTQLTVSGYYVGVAESGVGGDQEILIKDVSSDDIISVRGITYGTFPDYGYRYGDRVELTGTVSNKTSANNSIPSTKIYLDFVADENPEQIQDTVKSSGNIVNYAFDNVVEINSWAKMQEVFNASTLKSYTYITMSGDIYFNKYSSGSDKIVVYRPHLNGAASDLAGIKPDGTRSISLRDNVMTQNLGADYRDLFFDSEPSGYPGVKFHGSITALYIGGNGLYFNLVIMDESFVEAYEEEITNADALVTVAKTYYYQGNQIQYDQTQSRRNINPSPEEATAQHTLYLDCSSYVNSVYFETFGVNVLPYTTSQKSPSTENFNNYARDNKNAVEVMGYWDVADYTTTSAQQAVLKEIEAMLEVGDVVVYRHGATSGSSGHVMLYIGNGDWLHCTGSSYNYTDDPLNSEDKATTAEKTGGAIQTLVNADILSDTSSSRYLFRKTASDSVFSFAVLRPLNRGLSITAKTVKRMSIAGLSIERSVSAGLYNSVRKGDEITYTMTIVNKTTTAVKGVKITDIIPANADYVANSIAPDGVVTGKNIAWTVDVGASKTVTLSYKVKISSTSSDILVESSSALVNGIATNGLLNTISGYSADQMSSLVTKANEYISSKEEFTNPIEMVKSLYKDALNTDLFSYTGVSGTLSDLIDSNNNTFKTNTEVSKMLVPNNYGGLGIKSGFTKDNNRIRMLREEYLSVGDIILGAYNSNNNTVAYVYLGNGKMLGVYSGSNGKVAVSVTISSDAYKNILVTMIAYERYAVIRPSMVA